MMGIRRTAAKGTAKVLIATAYRPRLVPVAAGSFLMGSLATEAGRWADETQHPVKLSHPLLVAQTPITQGQYEEVMGENPAEFAPDAECPVEQVSFLDAVLYCNELSQREGLPRCYQIRGEQVHWLPTAGHYASGYRLPTEAEWEYVARANQRWLYAGSDGPERVACFAGSASGRTEPVGKRAPNDWKLHDLSGNVHEWVWDYYQAELGTGEVCDPRGPEAAEERVLRGGAWCSESGALRLAHRLSAPPDWRRNYIGFRIVRAMG